MTGDRVTADGFFLRAPGRVGVACVNMPFPDERRQVAVVDHRPEWSKEFERLAEQLSDALGDLPVAIDHVGSTSVPGLPANRPRWNGMGGLRVCSNTS